MDATLESMRMRAMALGIKHAEDMSKSDLIRAIQSAEGKRPCFNQRACRPSDHHACAWRDDCEARLGHTRGLVLSSNVIAGHQVAHLLSSAYGWKMQVVSRDKQAYVLITEDQVDVVVADIDSTELGGLAVLAHTKRHWPAVTTYAITRNEDAYAKQLALDMGGCQAFFYLAKGKRGLDTHHGLAARIDEQLGRDKRSRLDSVPQQTKTSSAGDREQALFTLLKQNQHSEETE